MGFVFEAVGEEVVVTMVGRFSGEGAGGGSWGRGQ